MIEAILPSSAVCVETFGDAYAPLFPEEEAALGRAVEKRRREFTTSRVCARRALGRLGFPAVPVPSGHDGEPLWPEGVVGSITHCRGYRASVVAWAEDVRAIGVDAEPHEPLPPGVLDTIARAEELAWLADVMRHAPGVSWDRLLFSAKEAAYKFWFPLARLRLGFEDVRVAVDPAKGTFSALVVRSTPSVSREIPRGFAGRWLVNDGLLLTAVALTAAPTCGVARGRHDPVRQPLEPRGNPRRLGAGIVE